jgi:NDP-4-keto-2,6-dideoxyhexose 3-C-methyltransferase
MKTWNNCRVCGSPVDPILSLGEQYVSIFLAPNQPDGPKAPLELVLCRQCRLLQLRHTVPGEMIYCEYWYRSGTNQTMRNALGDISNSAEKLMHLNARDSVLDIGCNDGTLLDSYTVPGIYKIGFDPAENLAVLSRKIADKVLVGFFDAERFFLDPDVGNRRPKVITSIAMFYDLDQPRKFVSDVQRVMHPGGIWIIQMSYLPLMLKQNDFGNICHEHLEYYSLHSLEYLLNLHGFSVLDAQLNDVNGGSIRVFIRNHSADQSAFGDEAYRKEAADRLSMLRESEAKLGLETVTPYLQFAGRVQKIKQQVSGFVKEQVERKKKIFVYGASTKGNTMLQYFGLDHSVIDAAAERNPEKWGKVTVGTRIPIISEAAARAARPDYFLVLPWHFIEEFKAREHAYLSSTGKFIVPLPEFELI